MNKSKLTAKEALMQIGKLLKMDFAHIEKFETAKLKDGTEVIWDGEFKEGTAIMVVSTDGNQMPAPDATHVLEDGTKIITVGGLVTAIEAKEIDEEDMASKFQKVLLELTEKFATIESNFNSMNEKFANYESKFSEIENTTKNNSTNIVEKFEAIKSIVEQLSNEASVNVPAPSNITFKKKTEKTGVEKLIEFKKTLNK